MSDWWKAPVLQGPENDYGEYDYLINQLPCNRNEWKRHSYKCKCDSCGRESHFIKETECFFYTIDGYDSMADYSCWRCELKGYLQSIKYRIQRKMKEIKKFLKYWKLCRKAGLKYKDIF